ncbi:hypothetical protein K431DRAFT_312366 [Polychaeton citri CBS 116435]|uniref:Uncharacterized protein n=1 Tax=Polychaeton citri CBS 116435 TaxID=1314669 RepID=A0A9P4QB62_9PEZI|nr:hypothetical protein K431DRAFT_312366 [Polychaeton citri CBS 116435]
MSEVSPVFCVNVNVPSIVRPEVTGEDEGIDPRLVKKLEENTALSELRDSRLEDNQEDVAVFNGIVEDSGASFAGERWANCTPGLDPSPPIPANIVHPPVVLENVTATQPLTYALEEVSHELADSLVDGSGELATASTVDARIERDVSGSMEVLTGEIGVRLDDVKDDGSVFLVVAGVRATLNEEKVPALLERFSWLLRAGVGLDAVTRWLLDIAIDELELVVKSQELGGIVKNEMVLILLADEDETVTPGTTEPNEAVVVPRPEDNVEDPKLADRPLLVKLLVNANEIVSLKLVDDEVPAVPEDRLLDEINIGQDDRLEDWLLNGILALSELKRLEDCVVDLLELCPIVNDVAAVIIDVAGDEKIDESVVSDVDQLLPAEVDENENDSTLLEVETTYELLGSDTKEDELIEVTELETTPLFVDMEAELLLEDVKAVPTLLTGVDNDEAGRLLIVFRDEA